MGNELTNLSAQMADAVARAGRSVVRVDDGTRLTASGVAWTEDLVVTTSHGVERDEDLAVETEGGRLGATLVGRDSGTDLAVLRIEGSLTPFETAEARLGALVLAVARPGEKGLRASLGVVGGRREAGQGALLHTDAALYPGFSGGALIDASGGLLGVLNLGWGRGRGGALDVDLVRDSVGAILGGGSVQRGYLGVRTQPAELPASAHAAAGQATGLLVAHVDAESPAQAAGIALGDVILRMGGRATDDPRSLRRLLRGFRAGQEVELDVFRSGAVHAVKATLGAQE